MASIVPEFPKILQTAGSFVPGGRFGGAISALQEFKNIQKTKSATNLASEKLGIEKIKANNAVDKNDLVQAVNIYNRYTDGLNKTNSAVIKAKGANVTSSDLSTPISFRDFAINQGFDVSKFSILNKGVGQTATTEVAPKTGNVGMPQQSSPMGLNMGQRIMGTALRGIGDAGGFVGRTLGGQVGEMGTRQVISNILNSIPGIKSAMTPRTPTTTGQSQKPLTQEAVTRLSQFTDADEAIEALDAVDNAYDDSGKRLEDDVDMDILIETFRSKFGDDAVEKLRKAVTED